MNAATLIREATQSGVVLRLDGGKIKASGRPEVLAAMVPQLREHRAELREFLADAHVTATALLEAAMRACDHHGDDARARAQMKAECLSIPPHLWKDLLDHLQRSYPRRPL
jgi:hypothetical protein